MSDQFEVNEHVAVKGTHVKKAPWWFWLVSTLSLFWYLMSCMNFMWQLDLTAEKLGMLSDAQKALIVDRPGWATAGFAIASLAGVIGCVLLLLKRSASLYFLLLSLVGLIASMVPVYGVIHSGVSFSAFEFGMYVIATPLLGLFLVWFAKHAKIKSWIR